MSREFFRSVPGPPRAPHVSYDKTAQALNNLAANVGAFAGISNQQNKELQQARAQADLFAGYINPEDYERDAAYSRTVSSTQNQEWMQSQYDEIKAFADDPSHSFGSMSNEDYQKYLYDNFNSRLKSLEEDKFKNLKSGDLTQLFSENISKLTANFSKIKTAQTQEKLIRSTTEYVTSLFSDPNRDPAMINENISKLESIKHITKKEMAGIFMSAATKAAADGRSVGIDYIESSVIGSFPELQGQLNSAKGILARKQNDINAKLVYDTRQDIALKAENGLFSREDADSLRVDERYAAISDSELISAVHRSREASQKLGHLQGLEAALIEGTTIPSASSSDLNRAADNVYDRFQIDGDPHTSISNYLPTVLKSGVMARKAKGYIERALVPNEPGDTASPEFANILTWYKEFSDEGKAGLFGLSEDQALALKYAYNSFNLAGDPNEAVKAAQNSYYQFLTNKAKGVVPAIIQNRKAFSKAVQVKMQDIAEESRSVWKWDSDDEVSMEVQAQLEDTAYNLSMKYNYDNPKDALDAAWEAMQGAGTVGRFGKYMYKEPEAGLKNIMQVSDVSEVHDYLKDSVWLKSVLPGVDTDEVKFSIVGSPDGSDALIYVSTPDSVVQPHILASKAAEMYRADTLAKEQLAAIDSFGNLLDKRKKVQAAKEAEAQRLLNQQSDYQNGNSPYRQAPSFAFRQIYLSTDNPDTREILMDAWKSYQRSPDKQKLKVAMKGVFGELSDRVLEAVTANDRTMVTQELLDLIGARGTSVDPLIEAEAISHAKAVKQMPEIGFLSKVAESASKLFHKKAFSMTNEKELESADIPEVVHQAMTERFPGMQELLSSYGISEDLSAPVEMFPASATFTQVPGDYENTGAYPYETAMGIVIGSSEGGINWSDDPAGTSGNPLKGTSVSSQYDHNWAFMGINTSSFPNWEGWKLIKGIVDDPNIQDKTGAVNELLHDPDVRTSAAKLYKEQYYDPTCQYLNDTRLSTLAFNIGMNTSLPVRGTDGKYKNLYGAALLRRAVNIVKTNKEGTWDTTEISKEEAKYMNSNADAIMPVFVQVIKDYYAAVIKSHPSKEKHRKEWMSRTESVAEQSGLPFEDLPEATKQSYLENLAVQEYQRGVK